MPFVQGHLRREPLTATFTTACAHCGEPMRVEVDSALRCRVPETAAPLAFVPFVNFAKLRAANIIDDF